MKWFYIKKTFRGGWTEYYMYFHDEATEDAVEEAIKDWGEHSNGGHEEGYNLRWKPVDEIPIKVVTDKIGELGRRRDSHIRAMQRIEVEILALTVISLELAARVNDESGNKRSVDERDQNGVGEGCC